VVTVEHLVRFFAVDDHDAAQLFESEAPSNSQMMEFLSEMESAEEVEEMLIETYGEGLASLPAEPAEGGDGEKSEEQDAEAAFLAAAAKAAAQGTHTHEEGEQDGGGDEEDEEDMVPDLPELTIQFDKDTMARDVLEEVATIGAGSFGAVKLVFHPDHPAVPMALKALSKAFVQQLGQQKQVMQERESMYSFSHVGLCRLYTTFQDNDCLYMLLEYLPGGELYQVRKREI
jgi:hypothetical protein